jgi:hypothetical protein
MTRTIGALCALVIAAATARAQPAGTPDHAGEARELYETGARLYDQGDYAQAVEAFHRAYALSGAKNLLFNIAQAYRLLGPEHCEQARTYYVAYLREDPTATNRDEIEEYISRMGECMAHAAPPEPQPPAPAPAPAPAAPVPAVTAPASSEVTPAGRRWLPIALGITGVGLGATGVVLYESAGSNYDRLSSTCGHSCAPSSWQTYETRERVGIGLAAGGGVALAAAAVWWIMGAHNDHHVWVSPRPGGMAAGATF